MKWIKRGLIYAPDGGSPWARKYAFPPTPVDLGNDVLRMYVAFCDDQMIGRVGFVDLDARDPSRVLGVSTLPVLDIGAPGAFDEHGVVPTSIVDVDGVLYMYYVGFQLGTYVRYYQFQGLATSEDGGETFTRYSRTPVIDRSDKELLNRTSAFVMRERGTFRMWYVGGSEWTSGRDGKRLPVYDLRYLESTDGKHWPPEGRVVIGLADDDEHALGRPCVFRHDGKYKMLFSSRTRSKGYRVGYAESPDGIQWIRHDAKAGIDVSQAGWDSEMIAYTSIVQRGERCWMFYNGNNCGATGFGWAELAEW